MTSNPEPHSCSRTKGFLTSPISTTIRTPALRGQTWIGVFGRTLAGRRGIQEVHKSAQEIRHVRPRPASKSWDEPTTSRPRNLQVEIRMKPPSLPGAPAHMGAGVCRERRGHARGQFPAPSPLAEPEVWVCGAFV